MQIIVYVHFHIFELHSATILKLKKKIIKIYLK